MKRVMVYLLWISLAMQCSSCKQKAPETAEPSAAEAGPIYQFELKDIDGNPVRLGGYSGKVLLLVNVASKCGYTPQYAGLEQLYQRYRAEGLVVLGFPANNFGSQEPGTDEEIKAFCATNYHVTFPMFAKISVKGDDIHPLYKFLAETAPMQSGSAGPVTWNFNKFLIGRDGSVVGRYDSKVEPLSPEMIGEIEKALAQASRWKAIAQPSRQSLP